VCLIRYSLPMNENVFAKLSRAFKEAHEFHGEHKPIIYLFQHRDDTIAAASARAFNGIQGRGLGALEINGPSSNRVEYQAVEVEAANLKAIEAFERLCHEAGVELPEKELARSGVKLDVTPELRWIAFLRHTLQKHHQFYLEHVNCKNAAASMGFECEKILQPFMASVKAIELAGLFHPAIKGGAVGGGMSCKEAIEKGERHIARNPYPGLNALAKIIGCSSATMSKAITRSLKLKAAKAQHAADQGGGREVSLTDIVLDNTIQTTEGDPSELTLIKLMAEQEADARQDARLPARKRSH